VIHCDSLSLAVILAAPVGHQMTAFLSLGGDLGLKAARRKRGRIGHKRAQRSQRKPTALFLFCALLRSFAAIASFCPGLARMREFRAIAWQDFLFLEGVTDRN
jgi:hypothetical protein